MKTKNHRKNTLGTKLFLKLFESEFDKLTLAEMIGIRETAAAKCKRKEQAMRAEAKKNAQAKTTAAGSRKTARSMETMRRRAV